MRSIVAFIAVFLLLSQAPAHACGGGGESFRSSMNSVASDSRRAALLAELEQGQAESERIEAKLRAINTAIKVVLIAKTASDAAMLGASIGLAGTGALTGNPAVFSTGLYGVEHYGTSLAEDAASISEEFSE